jgi:hypothetical protein
MEGITMSTTNGSPGYERTDANIASIWKFIIGLFVLIAVSLLAMLLLFRFLYRSEQSAMPAPTPMESRRLVPSGPKLQISNALDLTELRGKEEQELTTYGWVDKNAGVVRIPIGRAIELVAERGLPATPAPKPAAAKPAAGSQ